MDKFLIRPAVSASTSGNKRPAATPPGTFAGKKGKTSAAPTGTATKSTAAAWVKARSIPVPTAEYQDQTLLFTMLKDGRELLVGDAVWALPPAGAASTAALNSLECVGKMAGDRFAPLPGLDAVAVVIGSGFGATPQRLSLRALPAGTAEIIADVPLPGIAADRNYGGGGYIKKVHTVALPDDAGATCLLVCTDNRLFSFIVRETDGPERLT